MVIDVCKVRNTLYIDKTGKLAAFVFLIIFFMIISNMLDVIFIPLFFIIGVRFTPYSASF